MSPLSCFTRLLPYSLCQRTTLWVRSSPFASTCFDTLGLEVFRLRARSPIPLRPPAPALGCTSETGCEYPGIPFLNTRSDALRRRFVACSAQPEPNVGFASHTSRGFRSLWRHHRRSSVYPGLPPPAPSARGLSQTFDGLHLRSTRLFSFTQTPPMGFKEQRTACCILAVLTGPS